MRVCCAAITGHAPANPWPRADPTTRLRCPQVVSRWTGIPVDRLQQTEVEKLLHLKEELHKRVVGQERAVSAVADAVLRSRAGLAARNRGSSFLFLVSILLCRTTQSTSLAIRIGLHAALRNPQSSLGSGLTRCAPAMCRVRRAWARRS